MFKKILIGIVVIIAVFAGIIAIQPSEYRIVRTATINAPATNVFSRVNDFHNWEAWSPWAKLDSAAKNTFEGPPFGTGAIFKWAGNKDVGEGKMTIVESHPSDLVKIKLEFIKPFASVCATDFAFKGESNKIEVTWSMSGENNFIAKAFCLFMNMDKTVGGDFEKGLAQMKAVAEATPKSKP